MSMLDFGFKGLLWISQWKKEVAVEQGILDRVEVHTHRGMCLRHEKLCCILETLRLFGIAAD